MKKIIIAICALTWCLNLSATDYKYMVLVDKNGSEYSFDLKGLHIEFENNSIVINNSSSMKLTNLSWMQFSDTRSGVSEAIFESAERKLTAFNLQGMEVGCFTTFDELKQSLNQGIYVVKDSNGSVYKIEVGK